MIPSQKARLRDVEILLQTTLFRVGKRRAASRAYLDRKPHEAASLVDHDGSERHGSFFRKA